MRPPAGLAAAAALVAAALVAAAPSARAQDALAERVARAGDGTVRLAYPVRPGVCGDGRRGIVWARGDDTLYVGAWRELGGRRASWCEAGPARVALAVRGGRVESLRLTVGAAGGEATSGRVTDLGAVGAPEAAAYLLRLAARPDAPAAESAVLAAVVADAGAVWPELLRLARAGAASATARRAGTHWASQFACDAVRDASARRGPPAPADTADRAVRREAVFALSQLRGGEGLAPLARAARADRDPAVRCAALFWLGQAHGGAAARTGGPADALAVYEAVLGGR